MQPTLSQVCSLNSSLENDVEQYAAGACRSIELWLGKVETYLHTHTVDDLRQLLSEHEVSAPVASFQGGLLLSQGDARREHWDHFARRLELCQALGVSTLVIAGDIIGPLTQTDLERVQASLVQAAAQAGARG